MKAIRVHEFGGPEQMRLEEVPDPKPAQGQLVVRIHAAGVNPVDTYMLSGTYASRPPLPYTPGLDGAGVVAGVGERVKAFKPGDPVYVATAMSGTYAELALCTPAQVHALPQQVSFAQGAALGIPYATAYQALFHKAQAEPGETVLVHGASGGVGLACVQMGRAAGMTVIGTAGSERGRTLVAEQGADHVLDHTSPAYLEEIMKLTAGNGVDVILEMLANKNLGRDLPLLAKRGRVVVIGSRGTVEINPRDTMGRDASIHGMTLFNATERQLRSLHAGLQAGLRNGTLRPVIGREFSLAEAAQAHHAVMAAGAYGKIVLVP